MTNTNITLILIWLLLLKRERTGIQHALITILVDYFIYFDVMFNEITTKSIERY